MSHVRQVLRDAVVTSLSGLGTTGSNIFNTRIFPLAQSSLPCLTVFSESEEAEELTLGGNLDRAVSIVVTGYARATSNIENTLDTIAAEVEAAFNPGASAKYWTLAGTAFEFDGDGDNAIATIAMTFSVFYQTARSAPETAL